MATLWGFPSMVVPQNGWFLVENLVKMHDLGVPLFLETPKNMHGYYSSPRNFSAHTNRKFRPTARICQ